MGVSVPLKLKDSAGLQSFDSDDYDFLAYRAGLTLRQSDSSDTAGFTRFSPLTQNTRTVGYFIDTSFDSDVGTGGDASSLSTSQTTSYIYRNIGTDSIGTPETYTDSNYANFLYQTDSASQQELVAFSDSDWNVVTDEILSRIYKYDYAGSVRLASNVTDFDSANGGWSNILPNVFTDTRTSDSAGNRDSDNVVYNLYQKMDMTGIGVPSDSAKPFTMKYRADSAEINIAGAFKDIGRDSDLPNSKGRYYPSSTGVLSNTGLNRVAMAFTSLNSQQEFDSNSNLTLALDKEWNDKIYGVWQRANGPAGRGPHSGIRFTYDLKHYQQTQFSTAPNNSTYVNKTNNNDLTIHVYKDSANDTLPNRLGSRPQVWLGVKGRVDLVDSARFGSDAATFAATDATMQSYVESDGKWSFQFNFDSDATFILKRVTDLTSGTPNSFSQGGTYIYDSEGVVNLGSGQQYADVRISRPGYNYLQFPSSFSGDKAGQITTDSSTTAIIKQARSNGHFANLLSSFPTHSNFKGIGYDSADEINLILKNDFLGFQLADSDKLDETIGTRVRNKVITDGSIGSFKVLSSAEGTPNDAGHSGTWISKGVATDTRKAIIDTNYTRTRVSSYSRLRTSEYSTTFSDTYSVVRVSNYSDGYIGNYTSEYTRTRASTFTRESTRTVIDTYTRTSTRTSTATSGATQRVLLSQASGSSRWYSTQTNRVSFGNFEDWFAVTSGIASSGSSAISVENYNTNGTYLHGVNGHPTTSNMSRTNKSPSYTETIRTATTAQLTWIRGHQPGLAVTGGQDWIGNASTISYPYANGDYIQASPSGMGGYGATFAKNLTRAYALNNSSQPTFSNGIYPVGFDDNYGTVGLFCFYANNNNVYLVGINWLYSQDNSSNRGQTVCDFSTAVSTNYTGNYVGNYSRSRLDAYTGNFSRNFEGNYTREFTRTRSAFFSRNFAGNYVGNYSRNFQGNYVGNYVGNYTGADVSVPGGNTLTILGTHESDWGNVAGTQRSIGFNVPAGTKSVIVMSNVGTNGYRYTRLNSVNFVTPNINTYSMTKVDSAYSGNAEYSFESSVFAFSAAGIDTPNQFGGRAGSIYITHSNNTQVYGASVKIIFLNKAFTNHNPTSPTYWFSRSTNLTNTQGGVANHRFYIGGLSVGAATVYNAPTDGNTFIGITSGGSNKSFANSDPVQHVGDRDGIYGYEVVSNGSGVLTNNTTTPVSDGTSTYVAKSTLSGRHRNDFGETQIFVSWRPQAFTDNLANYTRTSTRTSLRSRSSVYSQDYTRTRTSVYLAGQSFSRNFAGEYTGNYIGNFSRNFIGDYTRNFEGNYAGDTIDVGNSTIETYTLYVKVG